MAEPAQEIIRAKRDGAALSRAQIEQTRHDIEDLLPLLTMPLFALVFLAVIQYSGRGDLTGYALIAPSLMTLGQMAIYVTSEIITRDRNFEILELIAQGLSNREIAEKVFVSENTVKTHSSRVFDKLGARRRTQAVQRGKELRLIP